MVMSVYLLGEFFESEVILILYIFTSNVDVQCCVGVSLTSLWINCFSSAPCVPQHKNEHQKLGRRDHGKISLY